ncbi:MAG: crossover junction endodeoxyribonuclease RuvC, partial [Fidelibacterota bacterium]
MSVILGVDPGSSITGYGVVNSIRGEICMVSCGCISTGEYSNFHDRLKQIYRELTAVIRRYNPDHFAVEEAFYSKNAKT